MPVLFDDVRFPEAIAYGARGGPAYATSVATLSGGAEKRVSQWQAALHRYNVSQTLRSQVQLDELVAFFHARKGRATGFRYKDWADYKAVNQNLGTGNGSIVQFQLRKRYQSGTQMVDRMITKPVSGTVQIYINSVLQTSGVSINYTTGIVAFSVAPASGAVVSADFEFDVPVRFGNDKLQLKIESAGVFAVENLELEEIRE